MTGCIPLRKGEICMNFPTIDRSFFAGECFDAYRVLGAHPYWRSLWYTEPAAAGRQKK